MSAKLPLFPSSTNIYLTLQARVLTTLINSLFEQQCWHEYLWYRVFLKSSQHKIYSNLIRKLSWSSVRQGTGHSWNCHSCLCRSAQSARWGLCQARRGSAERRTYASHLCRCNRHCSHRSDWRPGERRIMISFRSGLLATQPGFRFLDEWSKPARKAHLSLCRRFAISAQMMKYT